MTLTNTGTLVASKPFDEKAREIIEEVLGEPEDEWFQIRPASLEFQEFPSGSLDVSVDQLVDLLGKQGIQLEGRVDYDGSYTGANIWKRGEYHTDLSQDEVAIMDAGDQALLDELKRRGYNVQDLQMANRHSLAGIDAQNMDIARTIFSLPRTEAEDCWLGERFTTLSAKETIALSAAVKKGMPATVEDAINLLMCLPNHHILVGIHDNFGLGEQLIREQGIRLPDSLLKHLDTFLLGIEFKKEHPGEFIDDCYVIYPEAPLEAPYTGYDLDSLRSDDWCAKVRLVSSEKPEGVWLHLPDFSDAESISGLNEVEAALHALGVKSLAECGIAEARCILPEAGNLVEQYTDAETLISDANDLGAMLMMGEGIQPFRAKLSASVEPCNTLRSILDTMERYEFVSEDKMEDSVWDELKQYGIPEFWLEERFVSIRDYAKERLAEQGYRFDAKTGIYIKPKESEQEWNAMNEPRM